MFPLARRPLPRVGGKEDSLVLECERLARLGIEHGRRTHPALSHPSARKPTPDPLQNRFCVFGIDLAKDAVPVSIEATLRVTKGRGTLDYQRFSDRQRHWPLLWNAC